MKYAASLGLLLAAFFPAAAYALPLAGDNESGLEFPVVSNGDVSQCVWYVVDPTVAIQTGHARIIRLPLNPACIVATPGAATNADYMERVRRSEVVALDAGVGVVLDLHGFGYVHGVDITTPAGRADYLDILHKLVLAEKAILTPAEFRLLAVGLMNEPYAQTDAVYQPVFQAAINQLRADGFKGAIAYPATGYSGAHNITVDSTFMQGVTDSVPHALFAELHQYFDSDYSGTHTTPITDPQLGRKTLAGAEAWSRRTGYMIALDETGDPQPAVNGVDVASFPDGAWAQSDAYFCKFMYEAAASGRYIAIMPWGGGQYWNQSYLYRDYPIGTRLTAAGATLAQLSRALGQ